MAKHEPVEDRLWRRVNKQGGPESCWPWEGCGNGKGYGRIEDRGTRHYTHRLAYELLVGPIPRGLTLDHLCRNPACCNPQHLEPVTQGENNRRAFAARTECRHGHPFPENLATDKKGNTRCRECLRIKRRRLEAKKLQQGWATTSFVGTCAHCSWREEKPEGGKGSGGIGAWGHKRLFPDHEVVVERTQRRTLVLKTGVDLEEGSDG